MDKNSNLFNEEELKVVIVGYGEKRDSRVNIALEKTIRDKATKKCNRLGISLSESINQLLYIWSKNEKLDMDKQDQAEENQASLFEKEK